jgi:hypothetical protein
VSWAILIQLHNSCLWGGGFLFRVSNQHCSLIVISLRDQIMLIPVLNVKIYSIYLDNFWSRNDLFNYTHKVFFIKRTYLLHFINFTMKFILKCPLIIKVSSCSYSMTYLCFVCVCVQELLRGRRNIVGHRQNFLCLVRKTAQDTAFYSGYGILKMYFRIWNDKYFYIKFSLEL